LTVINVMGLLTGVSARIIAHVKMLLRFVSQFILRLAESYVS